ncbi:uncharacterized protein BX664DRAFT_349448 [Halteromyces radiatus]|uniref:uncharacterized protein n=1 Tax=Halteromyces radiatus TaxID=101107 RepID=UPI00221ED087|nr:uncharacterized protein BX664DRAFT_349448 [Halteromyces radiatus]KAI8089027.1 hypothetical protein BX664DRAFT_349448 [Halteromyces radiatus]
MRIHYSIGLLLGCIVLCQLVVGTTSSSQALKFDKRTWVSSHPTLIDKNVRSYLTKELVRRTYIMINSRSTTHRDDAYQDDNNALDYTGSQGNAPYTTTITTGSVIPSGQVDSMVTEIRSLFKDILSTNANNNNNDDDDSTNTKEWIDIVKDMIKALNRLFKAAALDDRLEMDDVLPSAEDGTLYAPNPNKKRSFSSSHHINHPDSYYQGPINNLKSSGRGKKSVEENGDGGTESDSQHHGEGGHEGGDGGTEGDSQHHSEGGHEGGDGGTEGDSQHHSEGGHEGGDGGTEGDSQHHIEGDGGKEGDSQRHGEGGHEGGDGGTEGDSQHHGEGGHEGGDGGAEGDSQHHIEGDGGKEGDAQHHRKDRHRESGDGGKEGDAQHHRKNGYGEGGDGGKEGDAEHHRNLQTPAKVKRSSVPDSQKVKEAAQTVLDLVDQLQAYAREDQVDDQKPLKALTLKIKQLVALITGKASPATDSN